MKVVIAEKPSVAKDIAQHLKATQRRDGYFEGNGVTVTWAFGHLVELQEPEEYDPALKAWRLSSLPIIPSEFKLRPKVSGSSKQQLETVKSLFDKAEELICATDAGREGELIFRYIQVWANCEKKPFRRLWISSLTKEAIRNGFQNLKDGHEFDNLYRAAKCRSEADWIVGLNGTRFFTVEYGKRSILWSIGRVQTPILAMIVGRDLEIENFKPDDFWEVHTFYREAKFKHVKGKIRDNKIADEILEKVKGQPFRIDKVTQKNEQSHSPLLYDLTSLQQDMNKRFGYTADQTLRIAQGLYEKKHLTYPRTDSRHLSQDLQPKIAPLLESLNAIKADEISKLDLQNLKFTKRIVDDSKVSDHHAIIPTEELGRGLSQEEATLYDAVVTRLLSVFYPPCIKAVTTVEASSNEEPFKGKGTVLVDPGWQALYPYMNKPKTAKKKTAKKKGAEKEEAQVMPDFEEGETGEHAPSVEKFKTSPPKYFTEATLLQLMETAGKIVTDENLKEALKDKGVGTPATRASIIEVLISRKYIERKRKNLVSTHAGQQLIALIKDERLKSPELTGDWEYRLKQVERGEYDPEKFMSEVEAYTREILDCTAEKSLDLKNLGPCPCCKAPVLRGKKGYGCSRWKEGCKFIVLDTFQKGLLTPLLMQELLINRRTLTPHSVQPAEGSEQTFCILILNTKGEFRYEPVKKAKKEEGDKSIGACPVCKSPVVVSDKAFGCSNWRNGCKFVIWKTIAQKNITQSIAKQLLKEGVTDVIDGFQSKAGKAFSAKLKLVNGEAKLDFS